MKSRLKTKLAITTLAALAILVAALPLVACFDWQHNVTLKAVAFEKARVDKNGLIIGLLKEETEIAGRPCQRNWIHLHPNGALATFAAAKPIELPRFTIPAGTWVRQNPDGIVAICAFPQDTQIQGHLCRGNGGPSGIQTAFYPSGALKQYFLRANTTIQGIPCEAGLFHQSIHLHENGRLKSCTLSADLTRDGITHPKGARLHLSADGQILR